MLNYPISMKEMGGGYVVTIPGIPGVITKGDSRKEAIREAANAIEAAFDSYLENGKPFPLPSTPSDGQYTTEISLEYVARILLHNLIIERGTNLFGLAAVINRALTPEDQKEIDLDAAVLAELFIPSYSFSIFYWQLAVQALGGNIDLIVRNASPSESEG